MRIGKFFIYLILVFIFISCNDSKYTVKQQYIVFGTKTSTIKVNYSDQDGISTVMLDPTSLPWTNEVELEGTKHKNKEWFLSAYSTSVGELAVVISSEQFASSILNYSDGVSSNYGVGDYVQTILKSSR